MRTSVVLSMLAGVGLAGNAAIGGWEHGVSVIKEAESTHFGLKNLDITGNKTAAQTTLIGTAASSCVPNESYGVDTVSAVNENDTLFKVYVRKIGEQALNPASVEQCIFEQTHLQSRVQVEAAH